MEGKGKGTLGGALRDALRVFVDNWSFVKYSSWDYRGDRLLLLSWHWNGKEIWDRDKDGDERWWHGGELGYGDVLSVAV